MNKFVIILAFLMILVSSFLQVGCTNGNNNQQRAATALALVSLDNKYFYIDKKGRTVINNPKYEECSSFSEGLAAVKTEGEKGKWGYINKAGKYEIYPQFDEALSFQ